MSLSVHLYIKDSFGDHLTVFDGNITHNLTDIAKEADIYQCLWEPGKLKLKYAKDLIPLLKKGLSKLVEEPAAFRKLNPENGWGNYEMFLKFCTEYLEGCQRFPDSYIWSWR